MADKNNFLIYKNWGKSVEKLTDEEAGKLFKSLFKYVDGREITEFDNLGTDMLYGIIVDSLERDLVKYKKTCEKNKKNGAKGGRPKKQEVKKETQKTQVVIEETQNNPNKPKKADIDKDKDKDIDKVKEIDKDIEYVIDYLNEITNSSFRISTKKYQTLIKTLLEDNYTIQDFQTVIDYKVYEWLNDSKMSKYLTPITLFNATKFPTYLNQAKRELNRIETIPQYQSFDDIFKEC